MWSRPTHDRHRLNPLADAPLHVVRRHGESCLPKITRIARRAPSCPSLWWHFSAIGEGHDKGIRDCATCISPAKDPSSNHTSEKRGAKARIRARAAEAARQSNLTIIDAHAPTNGCLGPSRLPFICEVLTRGGAFLQARIRILAHSGRTHPALSPGSAATRILMRPQLAVLGGVSNRPNRVD